MLNNQKNIINNFQSKCIHSGYKKESTRSHNTPVSVSATFYYDETNQGKQLFDGSSKDGYIYSRYGNPNIKEVEEKLAALESHGIPNLQVKALIHSSGMAAISTLLFSLLNQGDKILASQHLYSATQNIIQKLLVTKGVEFEFVNCNDPILLEQKFKENPKIKLIFIETPCNPLTECVDLQQLTSIAKKFNVLVSVDSTFATPYLQQPFKQGVDFVIHSTSKFLNGHGTSLGGVLIGKDLNFMENTALKFQKLTGNNSNGFDCFLLNQGIKTLPLRMDKHCLNARKVAEFLQTHSQIEKLWYLGFESHPSHNIAKKQMSKFGSIITFIIKGGYIRATQFMDKLQMCLRAVSLGYLDTLICHPASTTHQQIDKEQREKQGITDGLIRISVGTEDYQDIISDLKQALDNNSNSSLPKL